MRDFLTRFISAYFRDNQQLRLGQQFVNLYIKEPWPELFYEEDNYKAIEMISQWLKDNQYWEKEPPRVNK